jgi:hypothetical protein
VKTKKKKTVSANSEFGEFHFGEAILTIQIQPSVFQLNEIHPTINLTYDGKKNTVANNV